MFELLRKWHSCQATATLCQALLNEGLLPGMDPSTLHVTLQRGSYSGRGVRYFRVFDAIRVTERALNVRGYADLDAHPDLVLGSGHTMALVNPYPVVAAALDASVSATMTAMTAEAAISRRHQ